MQEYQWKEQSRAPSCSTVCCSTYVGSWFCVTKHIPVPCNGCHWWRWKKALAKHSISFFTTHPPPEKPPLLPPWSFLRPGSPFRQAEVGMEIPAIWSRCVCHQGCGIHLPGTGPFWWCHQMCRMAPNLSLFGGSNTVILWGWWKHVFSIVLLWIIA